MSGEYRMNRRRLVLNVNGADHEAWVLPSDTLLDVLHDELGRADVRYGCGEGVCGTCTVLLGGEPVNGCLILAVQAAGRPVTTLRGLMGPGETLHPLQECFLRRGASQCGFCTPGMVLTALDLVQRRGRPSREEIRYALVELDERADTIASARVALAGVADRVMLAGPELLAGLTGTAPTGGGDDAAVAVAARIAGSLDPSDDAHASGEYRRRLVRVLTVRALREAYARAAGAP